MQDVVRRFGNVFAFGACALLFIAMPAALEAQSGGTITGTVLDQATKSVQGAAITIKTIPAP